MVRCGFWPESGRKRASGARRESFEQLEHGQEGTGRNGTHPARRSGARRQLHGGGSQAEPRGAGYMGADLKGSRAAKGGMMPKPWPYNNRKELPVPAQGAYH